MLWGVQVAPSDVQGDPDTVMNRMLPLTATKNRGAYKGQPLFPHLHHDGMYVATKSKYEVDYVRVPTIEELAALVRAGYGARMSNADIPHAPSYIAHSKITLQDSGDSQGGLKAFLERFSEEEQLDSLGVANARKEQAFLRAYLLRGEANGQCVLCQEVLPGEVLVAAHIKQRSKCNSKERIDFDNVAALMCSLGCDSLFEKGYVYVQSGRVCENPRRNRTAHLERAIQRIVGQSVKNWSGSSAYYSWHAKEYGDKVE